MTIPTAKSGKSTEKSVLFMSSQQSEACVGFFSDSGTSEALHNFFIANDCPPMQGSWKAMIVFGTEPTRAVPYAFNSGLKVPD